MTSSHMKQLVRFGAISALVLGACAAEPALSTQASAVTIDDTDLAPECEGILDHVHTATLAELDAYLPSDVASAIVAARPFADIADLSAVPGIAQGRLWHIAERARALGFIGSSCAGIYEELAVSASDAAAILAYANTASEAELWDVVRTEPDTVAPLLVSRRPHGSLQYLVDTYGVGPSTFRSLRDAAVEDPFDELAGRVNDLGYQSEIRTAFNWYAVAGEQPGQQSGMLCFGVPWELVNSHGGQMRSNLATPQEVYDQVAFTVSYSGVGNSAAGLAHLAAQLAGKTFLGCYIEFQPNPWCGYTHAFFVSKETSYRVFTQTYWCE